jgi:hypothetical protein
METSFAGDAGGARFPMAKGWDELLWRHMEVLEDVLRGDSEVRSIIHPFIHSAAHPFIHFFEEIADRA